MFLLKEHEILEVMQEVVDQFLIPKFRELNMNATGEWLEHLEVEVRDGTTGVIRGRHYSQYLARGRAPGKRPPIAPIERWVNAKLGIGGSQGLGVAFAVANKIAREGTSWFPDGSDIIDILQSPEVIHHINKRFISLAQVEVKIAFERTVKEVFA